ncbi:hypothetical protein [Endozoicomonas sp. SCSIO W0465]|nr:hypothetical protein [Endozoicomonas sp. SCSIO W0465]
MQEIERLRLMIFKLKENGTPQHKIDELVRGWIREVRELGSTRND